MLLNNLTKILIIFERNFRLILVSAINTVSFKMQYSYVFRENLSYRIITIETWNGNYFL